MAQTSAPWQQSLQQSAAMQMSETARKHRGPAWTHRTCRWLRRRSSRFIGRLEMIVTRAIVTRPRGLPDQLRTCQARQRASRTAASRGVRFAARGQIAEQFHKPLNLLNNPLGNGVTVAQQTLTLFVLVQIQVPQPIQELPTLEFSPLKRRRVAWRATRSVPPCAASNSKPAHRCGNIASPIDQLLSRRDKRGSRARLPLSGRHAMLVRAKNKGRAKHRELSRALLRQIGIRQGLSENHHYEFQDYCSGCLAPPRSRSRSRATRPPRTRSSRSAPSFP